MPPSSSLRLERALQAPRMANCCMIAHNCSMPPSSRIGCQLSPSTIVRLLVELSWQWRDLYLFDSYSSLKRVFQQLQKMFMSTIGRSSSSDLSDFTWCRRQCQKTPRQHFKFCYSAYQHNLWSEILEYGNSLVLVYSQHIPIAPSLKKTQGK